MREADFVAPTSRRPEPNSSERGAVPKQESPIPGFTLTRTGHSSDWYAPASWSSPRPNPFPSRQEKLKQSLRTMSNSRWRRLQHQMQCRAFWR